MARLLGRAVSKRMALEINRAVPQVMRKHRTANQVTTLRSRAKRQAAKTDNQRENSNRQTKVIKATSNPENKDSRKAVSRATNRVRIRERIKTARSRANLAVRRAV